ncbi:MAG: cell wall hydrolase [Clostridia bacterium]|nr:cell wall hydrolase [Clostridia bacterium]
MRTKILAFLCCVISLITMSAYSGEAKEEKVNFDTPICLTVNDVYLKMDTEPFLFDGLTFVPIRFVSEALGAEVNWNAEKNSAQIKNDGANIELPAGKKYAYVNGKKVPVGHSVKLVNDRTYVPVRFVSENLGCNVGWDSSNYTVEIYKDGVVVNQNLIGKRGYSDDEIYWLSKIIHAESQGEPMEGKIAVGNVVLNRVKSKMFPNTIYGVIFDRTHGTQFSPVSDGSIYQTPLGDSVVAAKRALRGESKVSGSLYFLNPRIATSSWIVKNRIYHTTIANHDFYL